MVIKCSVIVSAGTIKAVAKLSPVSRIYVTSRLVTSFAGGSVDIIDQNSNIITSVAAPGSYQVEVLNEIVDDPDLNTTAIIDPL